MTDNEIIHRRLRITGRVQGVWYRGWTVDTARSFGLNGWVRNRADGSVEAVLSGAADAVGAMIDACWNGPPSAQVHNVECSAEPNAPNQGFAQRPTA